MKKLLIIIVLLAACFTIEAQSIFAPVPSDLFSKTVPDTILTDRGVLVVQTLEKQSEWIFRITGGVMGVSYYRDKETKEVKTLALNAICGGISYLHYKEVEGLPFNDFGFSAMVLQNVDQAGIGLGVFGTYNTGAVGLLNVGTHYDFSLDVFMLDTGLTWHF